MRNNPPVQVRRSLAAALLLMTVAGMPLFWLGAHVLEHHGHAEDRVASGAEWSEFAEILVHGHEHAEGVPDHEHDFLPSPTVRPDPPRDCQAPAVAALETPEPKHFLLYRARPWPGDIRPCGSSPPRLHLLCTLLI